MSMFFAQWIWWLVGAVGIGGTIALWFLAPVVAQPVLGGILRFLFQTRLGFGLMFAVGSFAFADTHRARLDQAEWNKKVAAFEQAQKDRDARIAEDTRAEVVAELAKEKLADAATQKAQEDFNANLKPLPPGDNPCRVGDDADKLRVISGKPGGEANGPVPAAGRDSSAAKHHSRKRL